MKAKRVTFQNSEFAVMDAQGRFIENVVWFEPETGKMGIAPSVSKDSFSFGNLFRLTVPALDSKGDTPVATVKMPGAYLVSRATGYQFTKSDLKDLGFASQLGKNYK